MQFSLSKAFLKGVAFLCPLSLSIPASHWHHCWNIYSCPVLLRRAKMDTWHKCLDVSFRARAKAADKPPTPSIQTKVKTSLPLPNYTLWLWNSDISDLHPCTWPVHSALLMVVAVFPLETYSHQGGTAVRPWHDMFIACLDSFWFVIVRFSSFSFSTLAKAFLQKTKKTKTSSTFIPSCHKKGSIFLFGGQLVETVEGFR